LHPPPRLSSRGSWNPALRPMRRARKGPNYPRLEKRLKGRTKFILQCNMTQSQLIVGEFPTAAPVAAHFLSNSAEEIPLQFWRSL